MANINSLEGWALMNSLFSKWHYFKDNLSACQRWQVIPGTPLQDGDDRDPICGHCMRVLQKWREKGVSQWIDPMFLSSAQ